MPPTCKSLAIATPPLVDKEAFMSLGDVALVLLSMLVFAFVSVSAMEWFQVCGCIMLIVGCCKVGNVV